MMKYYSKDVIIITLFVWTRHNGIEVKFPQISGERGNQGLENYEYMAASHSWKRKISGAKNAAVILPAALLANDKCIIDNLPYI